MATRVWTGAAQAVAHKVKVTPSNPEPGDIFTISIGKNNAKSVSFTVVDGSATVAAVCAGLIAAWNASVEPEIAEITATSVVDANSVATDVMLTHDTPGVPFSVTLSTTNAGTYDVTVTTIEDGSAAVNEKQTVTLPGSPTGGTFTLTFAGFTTSPIDATADNGDAVEILLEGLANITDVEVTGDAGGPWEVEFKGTSAGIDVPLMTGNGGSVTGAAEIDIETTTPGGPGGNEKQTITVVADPTQTANGYWRVSLDGNEAGPFSFNTGIHTVKSIMERDLPGVQAGDLSVSKSVSSDNTTATFTVVFAGQLAATNISEMVGSVGRSDGTQAVTSIAVDTIVEGSSTPVDEVQVVTIRNGPTSGTFTLTFSGQTTSPALDFDATALEVETALEGLSNIDAVSVTGNDGGPYTVTFQGTNAGTDVPLMTADASGLSGCSVAVVTTQEAAAAVNEIQSVSLDSGTSGGTFTLTFNAEETAGIAYDATSADVLSALVALTTPVAGDFNVDGPDGGPWDVEFVQNYAGADQTAMTGDGTNLTGGGTQDLTQSTDTQSTGPNWFDNANNWDGGAVPIDADTVIFEHSTVSCLYGLAQSAVTPAQIEVKSSYTGFIGLPVWTGTYYEYRDTYLALGNSGDAQTIELIVGEGDGDGSGRIKIDTGTAQTNIRVLNTSASADTIGGGERALTWKGTHASNTMRVIKGEVGVGVHAAEAATIATLDVSYLDSLSSDALVRLGSGVTLTTVNQSGGILDLECAATTITKTDGEINIDGTGAYTTITLDGGECKYNSSGTITTLSVAGGGDMDFSNDQRAKTVTNVVNMYEGSRVWDPFAVVTFTAGLKLNRCTLDDVELNVGENKTLTIS